MSTPLVSIGISFKNPGRHFRLALRSVFAQTFPDWELILVDDGSTDESGGYADSISDARVRVLRDGYSRNLNIRLNQMVLQARGEYFFRMDADDVMHPERIACQLAYLEKAHPQTVTGTAAFSINGQNEVVGIRVAAKKQLTGFSARHSFVHPTVAARRDWFLKNPYSEHFLYHRAQDAELWCRTSANSEFHVIPEPLLFYRECDTFSFPNYLGTSLGLLNLVEQYAASKRHFAVLLTREIAKLWLTTACFGFGCTDLVVNRRFKLLPPETRIQAQEILDCLSDSTRRGSYASECEYVGNNDAHSLSNYSS